MTLTPRTARARTARITRTINDLAIDIPRAVQHIHDHLNTIDGYGAGNSEVAVATSRGDSSTERAALARFNNHHGNDTHNDDDEGSRPGISEKLAEINEHLDALDGICNDMLTIVRPFAPQLSNEEKAAMRCSGGGNLHGALEWGRPDCTNIASPNRRDGLCDACRMRQSRWRNQPQQQTA